MGDEKKNEAKVRLEGLKDAADLMNSLDPEHRKILLKNMSQLDPDTTNMIKDTMFTFEDLIYVNPKGKEQLLAKVPRPTLALALRTTKKDFKEKLLESFSLRAKEMIHEEISDMGLKPISAIEKARQDILAIAKELEKEGKIVLSKSDEEV